MKALTLSALLLLLFAFIIALVETANLAPALPVVSFVYAILILAFFVGIFGLSMSVIRCVVSRRFYIVFAMFMLLCMAPMISVHHIVPVQYRLLLTNDVTTDSAETLQFHNSLSSRRAISRQLQGFEIFRIQHRVTQHPYLGTTHFSSNCRRILRIIVSSLSYRGWPINFSAISDSSIEASASFFFANSSSDMTIRMIDTPRGGCNVDVRSSSRNDFADWGHNILLIDRFIYTLKQMCRRQNVV